MSTRTISLIIPAFNEEKSIETCLEYAVRNSRGKFHEIIVVNNASTDRTKKLAQKIPNIKVVDEPIKGLTITRQRGLASATGDILAFVDADTRMPEGWIDTVKEEFEKNPNLACLSGPYRYFDVPLSQQLGVWAYWHILARPMYWIVGYMAVGGNFAIRKDILEKMGGFDTNVQFYGEDTNLARRASKFGKVKMNFKLIMPTSGRRFHGEGLFKPTVSYMSNFLSEVIFHRPTTKVYKDIR